MTILINDNLNRSILLMPYMIYSWYVVNYCRVALCVEWKLITTSRDSKHVVWRQKHIPRCSWLQARQFVSRVSVQLVGANCGHKRPRSCAQARSGWWTAFTRKIYDANASINLRASYVTRRLCLQTHLCDCRHIPLSTDHVKHMFFVKESLV